MGWGKVADYYHTDKIARWAKLLLILISNMILFSAPQLAPMGCGFIGLRWMLVLCVETFFAKWSVKTKRKKELWQIFWLSLCALMWS